MVPLQEVLWVISLMSLLSLLLSSSRYNGVDILVILVLKEAYLASTKALYIFAFFHRVESAILKGFNQLEFLSFKVSDSIHWLDYKVLFLTLRIADPTSGKSWLSAWLVWST